MDEEYDGPERRLYMRRDDDRKCARCDLLWTHHDNDKVDHRRSLHEHLEEIKNDVEAMRTDAKSLTPWKVFSLSMMILLGAIGWLATSIKDGTSKIEASVQTIHRRITDNDREYSNLRQSMGEIKSSLDSVANRLSEVEKKVNNQKQ